MSEIRKKTWPTYFHKVLSGEKKVELRIADFECKPGDVLVLEEWTRKRKHILGEPYEKKYRM